LLRAYRSTYISFFFYCYRHPRDLHSFPTRRSSDLKDIGEVAIVMLSPKMRIVARVDQLHVQPDSSTRALDTAFDHMRNTQSFCEDRKSTRLNSSHVSISYAVFCLKKKKNKQRQLHK